MAFQSKLKQSYLFLDSLLQSLVDQVAVYLDNGLLHTVEKDRETSLLLVFPVFSYFNSLVCLQDWHCAYCVIFKPIIGFKSLERPKKHIILVGFKRRLFGCPGDRLKHLLHHFECFFRSHVPSIHFL